MSALDGGVRDAIATAYAALSRAGADMRAIVEPLEAMRAALAGGDPLALDRLDDVRAMAPAEAVAALAPLGEMAVAALVEHALAGTPSRHDALAGLARAVAVWRGELARALWRAIEARGLGPDPADDPRLRAGLRDVIAAGVAHLYAGDAAGCYRMFVALAEVVEDRRCRVRLLASAAAVALFQHARPRRARELAARAAAIEPDLACVAAIHGHLAKTEDEAGEQFRRAVRLAAAESASDRASALGELAEHEARRGAVREAQVLAEDALRMGPGHLAGALALARSARTPEQLASIRGRLETLIERSGRVGWDRVVQRALLAVAAEAATAVGAGHVAQVWNAALGAILPAAAMLQQARWALADGDGDAAAGLVDGAVGRAPQVAEARVLQAEIALARGDAETLGAALAALATIEPDHFGLVTGPVALASAADPAAAHAGLVRCLDEEPDSAATAALVAYLVRRAAPGPDADGLRALLAARGALAPAAATWADEGNRSWGKPELAHAAYALAVWWEPSAWSLGNLALALVQLDRLDEAGAVVDRLDAIAATDAERARAVELRAVIANRDGNRLLAAGALDRAIARYRQSLGFDPDDPVVLSNLAEAHEQAAATADAEAHLDRAIAARQQCLRVRPGHPPDRASLIALQAKRTFVTRFDPRACGVPPRPEALAVLVAPDVWPAFVDGDGRLIPALGEPIARLQRAVTERHGVTLPRWTFQPEAGVPPGMVVVALHDVPVDVQVAGDAPLAALDRALAPFARAVLPEVIDHAMVRRALVEAGVTPPPEPEALTALTVVARAFVEEDVPLVPLAPWAEAVLACWEARPARVIELIDAVRASPGVRPRLPANQPGVTWVPIDEAVLAPVRAQIAAHGGNATLVPVEDFLLVVAWIRAAAARAECVAIVIEPSLRYLLSRLLAMTGPPVMMATEAERATPISTASATELDEPARAVAQTGGVER